MQKVHFLIFLHDHQLKNSEPSLLFSLLETMWVFDFTSVGLILIVLWYALLYLLIISFTLSIYRFFNIKVIYL